MTEKKIRIQIVRICVLSSRISNPGSFGSKLPDQSGIALPTKMKYSIRITVIIYFRFMNEHRI